MAAKLKDIRWKLRERMHEGLAETAKWLAKVVGGYYQYHAVPENEARLRGFRHDVLRLWFRQVNRRSQRSRWAWQAFKERLGPRIPEVEILHPWPNERFAAKHPR